ncbi:MAG: ActD-like protein [Kofleriaceae bacterium]
MTTVPDWLVERAALDEVPPASRDRLAGAELADPIAAIHTANAAELAAYPAGPAVAMIEARAATAAKRAAERRRLRRVTLVGLATSVAAIAVVAGLVFQHPSPVEPVASAHHQVNRDDGVRVKGSARLIAFRQVGDQVERLDADAVVHEGDLLQLRYNAGGNGYGVIASLDGAGGVTLHFPLREDGPTAMAAKTTTLPQAYALDDAPRFERFFIITSAEPIDVPAILSAIRALAARPDSGEAELDLPAGLHQRSLRLRKGTP